MTLWKLKGSGEKKFLEGHPWVHTRDLIVDGRMRPGGPVELRSRNGEFLARGYGNPESQIAFRAVSRDSSEKDFFTPDHLRRKILAAWKKRRASGCRESFRLFYSEADFFPGLIVDRYVGLKTTGEPFQVLSAQVLTAGAQAVAGDTASLLLPVVESARAEGLSDFSADQTAFILRNDVSVRKKEGLEVEPARVLRSPRDVDFRSIGLRVPRWAGEGFLVLKADLLEGQKTGLFLDQTENIRRLIVFLSENDIVKRGREISVLDLCSYVGHWSAQLTDFAVSRGDGVRVTQVDVSKAALVFARENAERIGGAVESIAGDVLKVLRDREEAFDIVIADPPAFAKSRKDLPIAERAYLKLNEQAFRWVRPGGLVVSCSCSGLLTAERFASLVEKAKSRARRESVRILEGGPGPDHPTLPGFPEGRYLKMTLHRARGDLQFKGVSRGADDDGAAI